MRADLSAESLAMLFETAGQPVPPLVDEVLSKSSWMRRSKVAKAFQDEMLRSGLFVEGGDGKPAPVDWISRFLAVSMLPEWQMAIDNPSIVLAVMYARAEQTALVRSAGDGFVIQLLEGDEARRSEFLRFAGLAPSDDGSLAPVSYCMSLEDSELLMNARDSGNLKDSAEVCTRKGWDTSAVVELLDSVVFEQDNMSTLRTVAFRPDHPSMTVACRFRPDNSGRVRSMRVKISPDENTSCIAEHASSEHLDFVLDFE